MKWKELPYWLKGGIFAVVIYIILNVFTLGFAALILSPVVLPFLLLPFYSMARNAW